AANGSLATAIHQVLLSYFASVPIGGFTTGVPTPGTMPFQAVADIIQSAAPGIRDVALTLNGGTMDVAIGAGSVPVVVYGNPASQTPAAGITFVTF
ncbi:MAG: hypothetical protein JOZ69_05405, partial [Myxococcales bacterium]|nr:hypothetical protein [Myxococcales bacterium]